MNLSKIVFLKHIDTMIGRLAVNIFPSPGRSLTNYTHFEKVLFIRPGGIGDAVLLIPVITKLHSVNPEAKIEILAEKRNIHMFLLCPHISKTHCYDKPSELLRAIRSRYDVVIDSEQWHRLSAVVAWMTRASISIGYGTNDREKLFTCSIPYSHDDYEVHSFLNLLTPLTGPLSVDLDKPFLYVPSYATIKIRSLLGSVLNKALVVLFPGGSLQERRWAGVRFYQTARALIGRGYSVVVVGGEDDRNVGDEIAAGFDDVTNFCGRLSLVETAAVLRESALLISGDSGILHLGFGLGIKTLSLFGPGIEKKWAPRGPRHMTINKNLACSPCTKFGYTPKCKIGAECMKQITVDEVFDKAITLLEG